MNLKISNGLNPQKQLNYNKQNVAFGEGIYAKLPQNAPALCKMLTDGKIKSYSFNRIMCQLLDDKKLIDEMISILTKKRILERNEFFRYRTMPEMYSGDIFIIGKSDTEKIDKLYKEYNIAARYRELDPVREASFKALKEIADNAKPVSTKILKDSKSIPKEMLKEIKQQFNLKLVEAKKAAAKNILDNVNIKQDEL